MTNRALVTGGAGFIGSHLCDSLLRNGWDVTVLDSLITGRQCNIQHLMGRGDFHFVRGDVTDTDLIGKLAAQADKVFHLAAMVSVPLSVEQPEECWRVNVQAFGSLLCALRERKTPLAYASSAAVYGSRSEGLRREEEPPMPLSPYGESKAINEIQAATASCEWGVPTVGFRFFNVYGPRQSSRGAYASVIPKFCSALVTGRTPVIYGDGGQTRDFISVHDIVEIVQRTPPATAGTLVYNVATGHSVTVAETLQLIAQHWKKPIQPDYKPERPGDIRLSAADTLKLQSVLKDYRFQPLSEGIAETLRWYAEHPED